MFAQTDHRKHQPSVLKTLRPDIMGIFAWACTLKFGPWRESLYMVYKDRASLQHWWSSQSFYIPPQKQLIRCHQRFRVNTGQKRRFMKIKNLCVIHFTTFFDRSWRFTRFLVELSVGSRSMDRDRQMSETLGHNTELGDSARWLWSHYLGFLIMLMKCAGRSGMFLMHA